MLLNFLSMVQQQYQNVNLMPLRSCSPIHDLSLSVEALWPTWIWILVNVIPNVNSSQHVQVSTIMLNIWNAKSSWWRYLELSWTRLMGGTFTLSIGTLGERYEETPRLTAKLLLLYQCKKIESPNFSLFISPDQVPKSATLPNRQCYA